MKIELTEAEVIILNKMLSMVQVNLDEAPQLIKLREKFKVVTPKA